MILTPILMNAATVTWTGGAGTTDWATAGNWDTGMVPGVGDVVIIDGSTTSVIFTGTTTVETVTVSGGGTLTIDGTLNIDGSSTDHALETTGNDGTIINNGTINITNVTGINSGTTLNRGISSKGDFTNNGTITIDGIGGDGIYVQEGTFTNSPMSSISITNSGSDYIRTDNNGTSLATLNNNGTIDIVVTMGDDAIFVNDGSTFNNASILNITTTGAGDEGIHLDNGGIFTNMAAGVVSVFAEDHAIILDDGTGTATLNNAGIININGTNGDQGLELQAGTVVNNTGTFNITNTAKEGIQLTSATATINNNNGGLFNLFSITTEALEIDAGTFNNNTGATYKAIDITDDAIQLDGGTFNNTGGTIETANIGSESMENNGATFTSSGIINIGCPNVDEFEIRNDLDFGSSCVNFDIPATGAGGTDYDRIENFSGSNITISSATAKLNFGTFVPQIDDCFTIVGGSGTVAGQFSSITSSDPSLNLDVTYSGTNVKVCIIPMSLPVSLISFEGRLENEVTVLNWATESEINNDYFEVEHSNNGRDFFSIAKVDGKENATSVQNYKCTHENPTNGDNYYRLKQVDFDGNFEYFNIIYIQYNKSNVPVAIYPNPAQDILFVEGGASKLTVYDINGRPVITQTTEEEKSIIDISNLEIGIYMIEISKETNEKIIKRFIKN